VLPSRGGEPLTSGSGWRRAVVDRIVGDTPGQRVLIVEEDAVIGRAAAAILMRRCGCSVEVVSALRDGVARAREWRPTIVVVDLPAGSREGIEIVACLALIECAPAPRLVVCCDDSGPMVPNAALLLAKPCRVGSLVNAVRTTALMG
jgi:CheY-like chemotaxis protein